MEDVSLMYSHKTFTSHVEKKVTCSRTRTQILHFYNKLIVLFLLLSEETQPPVSLKTHCSFLQQIRSYYSSVCICAIAYPSIVTRLKRFYAFSLRKLEKRSEKSLLETFLYNLLCEQTTSLCETELRSWHSQTNQKKCCFLMDAESPSYSFATSLGMKLKHTNGCNWNVIHVTSTTEMEWEDSVIIVLEDAHWMKNYKEYNNATMNYLTIKNDNKKLIVLSLQPKKQFHAQGVVSTTFNYHNSYFVNVGFLGYSRTLTHLVRFIAESS